MAKKRILIFTAHANMFYSFRKEFVQRLIDNDYEVYFSCAYYEKAKLLEEMGAKYVKIEINRRGMNPFQDFVLYRNYVKIIKKVNPDIVSLYTIKPNIYGGLACRKLKVPYISTITGLGSVFNKRDIIYKLVVFLYKKSFKKVRKVFFQNNENMQQLQEIGVIDQRRSVRVSGSGVNVDYYQPIEKDNNGKIAFLFIARVLKEKGIDQFIDAAKHFKDKNTEFQVLGFLEDDIYQKRFEALEKEGVIRYLGYSKDTRIEMANAHCIVLPSYYPEGMNNVLQEGAACGLPVITTNNIGCKDVVDDGVTGFLCEPMSSESLIQVIEQFLKLPDNERLKMGLAGRRKMENEFDRSKVIDSYMEEIKKIIN